MINLSSLLSDDFGIATFEILTRSQHLEENFCDFRQLIEIQVTVSVNVVDSGYKCL